MPKFGWKAIYEDGTIYRQYLYDKNGQLESRGDSYGLVEAKGMPLYFFIGSGYGVNLKTGEFLIKRRWQMFCDINGEALHPAGLIHFRRREAVLNLDGIWQTTPNILHVVGYVYSEVRRPYWPEEKVARLMIPHDGRPPAICIGSKLPWAERKPVWRK